MMKTWIVALACVLGVAACKKSSSGSGAAGGGVAGMSTAGTGTGTAGTSTAGGAATPTCASYCSCMSANCALSVFPGNQTCMAFCATGSATALSCWNLHCYNAASMGKNGVHCTHATGDGTVCPKM
jgi:hypothetical protein